MQNFVYSHMPTEYYVVFADFVEKERRGLNRVGSWLLSRLLKKGYRHVFAISSGMSALIVDPSNSGLRISLATAGYRAGLLANPNIKVLRVKVKKGLSSALPINVGCVATMKYLLGVRSWWIVTPYQLYQHVQKD